MTRDELEHAIRAACDLTKEHELIVFGSQAILGQFPDAPEELLQSAEVDVAPLPDVADAERIVGIIDGSLGELSTFHNQHGFYVHGVPLETAVLPTGWQRRLIRVQNGNTRNNAGLCIEAHDLAASKLAAFREKDRDFVRVLIVKEMIKPRTLITRIRRLDVPLETITRLVRWVDRTVQDA